MKRKFFFSITIVYSIAMIFLANACMHDPILGGEVVNPDTTTNPIDTVMPPDTMDLTIPCDSNIIYFSTEILPIFRSNCAIGGCHDEVTAEKGIVLTDYEKVISTGKIEPYNLAKSELYEKLVDPDPESRMPPDPRTQLDQNQLALIAKWILQGAEDYTCDLDTSCQRENVSFSQDIWPVINVTCKGCHSGPSPNGGIALQDYNTIKMAAESGRLYGAISWTDGFTRMPKDQSQLTQCYIDQLKNWIDSGYPDN
jgi:hypothetical protein